MIDMQKFSQWIATVQGQYINMDGAYGAQCWDLHAHFADTFGLPRIDTGYPGRWSGWAGNMYDAYPQNDAIAAAYERIPGDQPAQAGDTVIWDDSFWYYPKTHVATVVQDGAQLLCMSQNSTPSQAGNPYPQWSTGPATIQHLPKGGLLGYLRPRTSISVQGATATSIQEDDMSAEELKIIRADINSVHETVIAGQGVARADIATVHNTIIRDVGGQLGALRELVKQLAAGQGVVIDYDRVEAAAKDGAASALAAGIEVTVSVKDGK